MKTWRCICRLLQNVAVAIFAYVLCYRIEDAEITVPTATRIIVIFLCLILFRLGEKGND